MKKVLLILAGLSLLAGCGGGGNSSSGGNANFTGQTTQATVTTSNAKALSIDAYTGGQMSSGVNVVGKEVAGPSGSLASLPELSGNLENSIRACVDQSAKSSAKSAAAAVQDADTIFGFSGSYSYIVNADTVSGAFSGTITFTQYKELSNSPVMSGSMAFSGVLNPATGTFVTMNATLSSLTVTSSTESLILIGSMTWQNSGTTASLNLSIVLKDNTSGKTYWAKDFNYQQTATAQLMTGTYYDHDHGYVVISTSVQLTSVSMDSQPTAGRLLFSGSNGTKARLTFSGSSYTVEADTTGNGTFVVIP